MMILRNIFLMFLVTVISCVVPGSAAADNDAGDSTFGVFEYVVEQAEGSLAEIVASLEGAVTGAGWQLLATAEGGIPEDCSYQSRVICCYDPAYAAALIEANSVTGAYAVVDRIGIFEDENGTHVSIVNPNSINRTILMDDTNYLEMSETHRLALREMIAAAITGTTSRKQYGQPRSEGYIGKTMGVVAGGKFSDMIKDKGKTGNGSLSEVAGRMRNTLGQTSKKWGLHQVYTVDLSEFGIIVMGTTGEELSRKSYEIVKSGLDDSRQDFACPGNAYVAAYPLEIVLYQEGDNVSVSMVEAMFRMKMYFEDAGKWSFMNNMKMPGSIDKELKKQIKKGLKGS